MKKIEVIQPSKMVSAYGGVGSIIETVSNGSLLLSPYNQWYCFKGSHIKPLEIKDDRLLQHIQKGCKPIRRIYYIPTDDIGGSKSYNPSSDTKKSAISSEFFPKWFYCPRCHRLETYQKWEESWYEKYPEQKKNTKFRDYPPACCFCSKPRGKTKRQISRKPLEQIRYVMASLGGGLMDIPFRQLVRYKEENPDSIGWEKISLPKEDSQRELFWKYAPNSKGEDFLNLIANGEGGNITLPMTLLQTPYIEYEGEVYKIFMRNQNNLYYPDRIGSIYIPEAISKEKQTFILDRLEKGVSPSKMQDETISLEDIYYLQQFKALDFDLQEYLFITNDEFYKNDSQHSKSDANFSAQRYVNMGIPFVSKVYAIDKLKEISVVLEYTRLAPKGKGIRWWNQEEGREVDNMKAKPRKTYNEASHTPDFIPGIECCGEGVFFELDTEQIQLRDGDDGEKLKVFVHTFSHIIMRELEFSCGYTLASLAERLYILDNKRVGILIYTVSANYGGLPALCSTDQFPGDAPIVGIVKRALERAKVCVNDPICEGHCYACLDIPEISCCNWNNNIDRRLLTNQISESH